MQHLGLLFTLALLATNLWGLMLIAGTYWRNRWFAMVAAPILAVTGMYAIECQHGLGPSLPGLGLFSTLVSVALIGLSSVSWEPAGVGPRATGLLREWRREFAPGRLVGCSAAFAAIFLAGGVLHTLRTDVEPRPFAAALFLGGGRFYGRFFRLGIFSLLLWLPAGVLFVIFDGVLSAVQSDPNREQLGFILTLARYAFALALFQLIRMISDYARIRIAVRDSRDTLAELGRAVLFVGGRFGRTLGLYVLLALAGLALLVAFGILDSSLAKTTPAAIFAGFVLTQIFVAARGGLRIASLSAQRGFFLQETRAGEGGASGPAVPASAGAAQHPRGEVDQRPEELQAGAERDADQTERQQEKPDERIQDQHEEGQGPANDEQNQP